MSGTHTQKWTIVTVYFLLFKFSFSHSLSFLFSSSFSNYTNVTISSIFLVISLLLLLLFIPFLSPAFPLRCSFPAFQFSSSSFFTLGLIIIFVISTQFSSFIGLPSLNFCLFSFLLSPPFLFIFFEKFFFSVFFFLLFFLFLFQLYQCDDFLNFPCHFLGAVLPAPALYPSLWISLDSHTIIHNNEKY